MKHEMAEIRIEIKALTIAQTERMNLLKDNVVKTQSSTTADVRSIQTAHVTENTGENHDTSENDSSDCEDESSFEIPSAQPQN